MIPKPYLVLLFLFIAVSVTAQSPAPPSGTKTALLDDTIHVAAKDTSAPAPLTEVESLKVQNVNLERVIVQRAVDDWQKHLAAVKAELEKSRPGWIWNPEDGSWKKDAPPAATGSAK